MFLLNAISLNMLPPSGGRLSWQPLSSAEARRRVSLSEVVDAIGHLATDRVVSDALGREPDGQRLTVALEGGDSALVAQYRGPRLPEGAVVLPEGAEIKFFLVEVLEVSTSTSTSTSTAAETELRAEARERFVDSRWSEARPLAEIAGLHRGRVDHASALPPADLEVATRKIAGGKRPLYADATGRIWSGTHFGRESGFGEVTHLLELAEALLEGAELARFRARYPELKR